MILSGSEGRDGVKPPHGCHHASLGAPKVREVCAEPGAGPGALGLPRPCPAFWGGRGKGREEESWADSQTDAVQNLNPAGVRLSRSAKLSLAVTGK